MSNAASAAAWVTRWFCHCHMSDIESCCQLSLVTVNWDLLVGGPHRICHAAAGELLENHHPRCVSENQRSVQGMAPAWPVHLPVSSRWSRCICVCTGEGNYGSVVYLKLDTRWVTRDCVVSGVIVFTLSDLCMALCWECVVVWICWMDSCVRLDISASVLVYRMDVIQYL